MAAFVRRYPAWQVHPVITGFFQCASRNAIFVYRVPGHPAVDAALRRIARRHGVGIRLVDTRYPPDVLDKVVKAVETRRSPLLREAEGVSVIVRRTGDKKIARRVLADFKDTVEVGHLGLNTVPL
jgi:hypothetical protein